MKAHLFRGHKPSTDRQRASDSFHTLCGRSLKGWHLVDRPQDATCATCRRMQYQNGLDAFAESRS